MVRSLLRPSSGQHLIVKGTVIVHYTLWDPICLQNVRKNNYKTYLRLKYCRTWCNVKAKWSRYRSGVAQRVGRGIALLFHDRGTRRGEWSAARPGRTLPPAKTRYPFYRRLGGPRGRSGRAENLVPTGILSRTVQPLVSRYTDWATRPTGTGCSISKTVYRCLQSIRRVLSLYSSSEYN
jgi:hypothetical protein